MTVNITEKLYMLAGKLPLWGPENAKLGMQA